MGHSKTRPPLVTQSFEKYKLKTSPPTPTTSIAVPKEIPEQFQMLRSKCRSYAVLSGALLLASFAVVVYWLTTGLDEAWFALQTLELPRSFRVAVSLLLLTATLWLAVRYLLIPGVRRVSDNDIALLLERRFPAFQDRLITVVESRQHYPASGPHMESMLTRTADQAQSILQSVSTDKIFETKPLRKQSWIAGLLALTVIGHSLISHGAISRWLSAFVQCEETYHIRKTDLAFTVLAAPGERRVEFSDKSTKPLYRHSRGSDFQLLIEVPDRPADEGNAWVVPERVRVDITRQDGTSSRSYVSRSTDNSYRFILTRLQEDIQIEVLGGDYRTPVPLQIQSVNPPALDQLSAVCRYPDYTGWNQERGPDVEILSSELALPMGTEFRLNATSSKVLQGVRIVTDDFEIESDGTRSQLQSRDESKFVSRDLPGMLSADGLSFEMPFRIESMASGATLTDSVAATDSPTAADAAANSVSKNASEVVLLSPNTNLKIFLHDEDNIITSNPESLRINGIADKPPVIGIRQTGVTNAITRRAIIPVTGRIQDDYGIASAEFQFLVDDESQWRRRTLRSGFRPGLEFQLTESGKDKEYFAVQPLDLSEGQTLAVTLVATDECNLPEANESRAEPMVFRIVSNEELLSLMYSQELTLRRRFEEVISKLEQVESSLLFHNDIVGRLETQSQDASQKAADLASLNRCAESSGNTLRRQKNELDAIREAFQEIAQQLINNAIPPRQLADNMQDQIIEPLQNISQTSVSKADRSLSRFKVAAGKGLPTTDLLPAAQKDVRSIINQLKTILEQVRDMAEFHEAPSDLKNIMEYQKRIMEETKRQQIKNLGGL